MSDAAIVLSQARFAITTALRTRRTIFLTVLFPVILLILFNSIFTSSGNQNTTLPNGHRLDIQAYFTAGLLAYAATLSTFTTLAVMITTKRESGELKRFRGTPMPAWTFIAAWIIRTLAQVALMAVVLLGIGAIAYGVKIPAGQAVGLVVYLLLGTASMCAGDRDHRLHPESSTPPRRSAFGRNPLLLLRRLDSVDQPGNTLQHLSASCSRSITCERLQTTLDPSAGGIGLSGDNVFASAGLDCDRGRGRHPPLPVGTAGRPGLRGGRHRRPGVESHSDGRALPAHRSASWTRS